MPASTAITLSLLEPAVAAVLAVLVVGERLPATGWTGIALVIACLAVLTTPTDGIDRGSRRASARRDGAPAPDRARMAER
ncbi:hypothetical protein [Streptomyces venetus]|uniref:hypothetical protein n=1 Tax=Streptomyces venetus TaxID=1701086 RepID=UPI003C3023B3